MPTATNTIFQCSRLTFKTKEEALKDADEMGLKGFHTHKTEDGETLYMAGPNHESFMKKHKEMTKAGWHSGKKK